jgi:hypothetical protein
MTSSAAPGARQGKPAPDGKAKAAGQDAEENFWESRERRRIVASAQLAAVADIFMACAMRIQGNRDLLWTEGDIVPDLHQPWLQGVRDNVPFADLRPKNPEDVGKMHKKPGFAEYMAYSQALIFAKRTPAETFARAAADNAHIKFDTIYNNAAIHRGKVIHMEGMLRRLDRRDSPLPALVQGVPHFYEGWITLDRRGLPPVCVVFPDLPEGLEIGEDLNRRVSFNGYFFKKYRYRAQDDKDRTTLLFVAPTLKLLPSAARRADDDSRISHTLLMGIIGCAVLTIGLIVALNLWYRQSDRHVRARLTELQSSRVFDEEALLGEDAGMAHHPGTGITERKGPEANGPSAAHGTDS